MTKAVRLPLGDADLEGAPAGEGLGYLQGRRMPDSAGTADTASANHHGARSGPGEQAADLLGASCCEARVTLVLGASGTGKTTLLQRALESSPSVTWGRFVPRAGQIVVDDNRCPPHSPELRGEAAWADDSVRVHQTPHGGHLVLVRRDAHRYAHLAIDPAVGVFLFRSQQAADDELSVLLGLTAHDAAPLIAEARRLPIGSCLHRAPSDTVNTYGRCARLAVGPPNPPDRS